MTTGLDTGDFADSAAERRIAARLPLVLGAQCALGFEQLWDVFMINVSRSGCQVFAQSGLLRSGQDITLFRAGGELRQGQVTWAAGMKAGVHFDLAISNQCLEQLLTAPPLPAIVGGAADPFMDRFGRALAPLPALGRATGRR